MRSLFAALFLMLAPTLSNSAITDHARGWLAADVHIHNYVGEETTKTYYVDEFRDLISSTATLVIEDKSSDQKLERVTYYKKSSFLDTAPAISRYRPKEQKCIEESLENWDLAAIKKTIKQSQENILDKITAHDRMVSVGPSLMLLACNAIEDRMIYWQTIIMRHWISAALFRVDLDTDDPDIKIFVFVAVDESSIAEPKKGLKLSNFSGMPVSIAMMIMRKEDLPSWSDQWTDWKVLSGIQANFYTYQPLSLARQQGLITGEYINPFAIPSGIGCGSSLRGSIPIRLADQFSAVAVINDWTHVYLAYDATTQTFRRDRHQTKFIANLKQKWAYMVHEFDVKSTKTANKCSFTSLKDEEVEGYESVNNILGLVPSNRSNESNDYKLSDLGVSQVDGFPCRIYERRMDPSDVPRVFGDFRGRYSDDAIHYLVFSFIDERSKVDRGEDGQVVMMRKLRRIEWVTYNEKSRGQKRQVQHSIEFIDFSWSLDVDPDDNQRPDRIVQTFDITECMDRRNHELQLEFVIDQTNESRARSETALKLLRQRANSLEEWSIRTVSNQFSIGRSQVTQLSSQLRGTSVVVTATIHDVPDITYEASHLTYLTRGSGAIRDADLDIGFAFSEAECLLIGALTSIVDRIILCPKYRSCATVEASVKFASNETDRNQPSGNNWCEIRNVIRRSTGFGSTLRWIDSISDFKSELINQTTKLVLLEAHSKSGLKNEIVFDGIVTSVSAIKQGATQGLNVLNGVGYLTPSLTDNPQGDWQKFITERVQLANRHGAAICHKLCQMNAICRSFSICRSSSAETLNECILSNVEIDEALISAVNNNDSLTEYQVNDKLTAKFTRTSQCSIHTIDYLDLYRRSAVTSLTTSKQTTTTLEDCARECHSHELEDESGNYGCKQFVYCPDSQLCAAFHQSKDSISQRDTSAAETFKSHDNCRLYNRDYERFFQQEQNSKLELEQASDQVKEAVTSYMIGLTKENCARHCLIADRTCKAFDYCLFRGKGPALECFFHHIASPSTARLINEAHLSQLEKKFYQYGNGTVPLTAELSWSDSCKHYYLSHGLAQVKVEMAEQAAPDSERSPVEEAVEKIDTETQQEYIEKFNYSVKRLIKGSGSSFMFLLIGLILGCLTLVAFTPIKTRVMDIYIRRTRRQQQEFRFSVLNLPDHDGIE